MRYLKEMSQIFNLYRQIERSEAKEWEDNRKKEKFDSKDYRIISKFIKQIPCEVSLTKYETQCMIEIEYSKYEARGINIIKFDDEYYLCGMYELTRSGADDRWEEVYNINDDGFDFLCDQIDGLTQFFDYLKDNFIN